MHNVKMYDMELEWRWYVGTDGLEDVEMEAVLRTLSVFSQHKYSQLLS